MLRILLDRRAALVAIAALGGYAVYDASIYYPAPEQRIFYALAVLPVLLGGAAALLARTPLARAQRVAVGVLAALQVLPGLTALLAGNTGVTHLIGDLATVAVPGACVLYFAARGDALTEGRGPLLLLGLLAVASVVAPLLGRNHAGRFEPPQILLVAAALAVLVHRRALLPRLAAVAALAAMVALTLGSGLRTTLITMLVLCGAAAVQRLGWRRAGEAAGVTALALTLLLVVIPADARVSFAGKYRFEDVALGRFDSSLLYRLDEAVDIGREMEDWGPLQWAFGAGHGAVWTPDQALRVKGIERSMLPGGAIHQVHILPVALAFRCGLLGVAAWLLLAGHAVAPFLSRRRMAAADPPATMYRLALLGYVTMSLTTAVMVQPLLGVALAGSLLPPPRRRLAA